MRVFLVSRCSWTFYNFRAGLAKALLARQFVVVGGGAGGDQYEEKILSLGIPFKNLPVDMKGINPLADMRLIVALYRWYRQERPDVVHHFTIKPVIYGSIAARLAGVRRIVNTITGLGYVYTERKGALRLLVDQLYRLALGFAQRIFFQNEDDRGLFISRGLVSREKTSLVPGSGVDIDHFHPGYIFEQQPAKSGEVVVLMLSRLLRDKGIYEFVEAARMVIAAVPNVKFQVLGEIDRRNPSAVSSEEVEAWQFKGILRWLGHTDEVRPHISRADIVVLPSYREGTPRSLLEASAMGKPVIATDVVGCREAVEHDVTGLLVPVRNAGALASAIMTLAGDPATRTRMGAAGREKMIRQFDEQIVIGLAIKAYNGAL